MTQNIFDPIVSNELVARIKQLQATDQALWGKMSADRMLAHCNVAYDMTYEPQRFAQPGAFKKFLLKAFVKKMVTSEKPYPKNSRTAPEFLIVDAQNFEEQKQKLIDNIQKTQQLGAAFFEGKENHSFGKMTAQEWNNLFYKHLNHHLAQFGK